MKFLVGGVVMALAAVSGVAMAQKAATSGPTKVTGDPVKTASGLEYWDI